MASNITESLVGLWQMICNAFLGPQTALVRGRVAGKSVLDSSGKLIVDAGRPIDEAVIARAKAAGKLSAVMAVAVSAKTQDIKEKFGQFYGRTERGQEERALKSLDSYVEARKYLGRALGMDVTDIRGNVIVPAGKQIDNQDVRACRDAEQLGALIFAAEQAPPAPADWKPAPEPQPEERIYTPPASRVSPTFLATPDEDETPHISRRR